MLLCAFVFSLRVCFCYLFDVFFVEGLSLLTSFLSSDFPWPYFMARQVVVHSIMRPVRGTSSDKDMVCENVQIGHSVIEECIVWARSPKPGKKASRKGPPQEGSNRSGSTEPRKPRLAQRFEEFGKTSGLEYFLFYKVSANYDGFGAGVFVFLISKNLLCLKGLLANTVCGSVCRGSGAQEPVSTRKSMARGRDERPRPEHHGFNHTKTLHLAVLSVKKRSLNNSFRVFRSLDACRVFSKRS